MSQSDNKEIAKARFITGETIAAIADAIGVSRRTIERWADEGNWRDLKAQLPTQKAPNVVTLQRKSPESREQRSTEFTHPPIRRRSLKGEQIDELEAIEDAIANLSAALAGEIDPKSMGSVAGALIKLFERRAKLQPKTAAEVVELAIDLGISPEEFIDQLEVAWQRRA